MNEAKRSCSGRYTLNFVLHHASIMSYAKDIVHLRFTICNILVMPFSIGNLVCSSIGIKHIHTQRGNVVYTYIYMYV